MPTTIRNIFYTKSKCPTVDLFQAEDIPTCILLKMSVRSGIELNDAQVGRKSPLYRQVDRDSRTSGDSRPP